MDKKQTQLEKLFDDRDRLREELREATIKGEWEKLSEIYGRLNAASQAYWAEKMAVRS